jgi:hypothetical protein
LPGVAYLPKATIFGSFAIVSEIQTIYMDGIGYLAEAPAFGSFEMQVINMDGLEGSVRLFFLCSFAFLLTYRKMEKRA